MLGANCMADPLVDMWVRYFEERNALANMMLAPPGAMRSPIAAERPGTMTRMACPTCGGMGDVIAQEPDYGQWEGRLNKAGKKVRTRCPMCNGRKGWQAYFNPKELYAIVTRARNIFMTAHQTNGDISVGQAFVSRQLHDASHRKQLKLVEETYAKPCSKCEWTGIEECKKCKGAGTVKCPNKDCKSGWIVTKTVTEYSPSHSRGSYHHHGSRHSSRRESVAVEQCPVCKAASAVICEDCQGRRAQPCSKCHGLGFKQKH